jgi:branched-chain amino acid transport system substrate-binding protein
LSANRRSALAAGLLLAASTVACGGRGEIRFGAVLPITGHAAVYGKTIRQGVELAHEELRKEPAFAALELVVVDSGSDPERAKNELRRIYAEGALAAIGGVTSAEALAMVEGGRRRRRTLLSPSASLPQLSGISSNFFRVFPSDFAEGTVMARYAYDNLRLRDGVVFAKEETYAKGIQKVFSDEFQRHSGRILETIEFPPNTERVRRPRRPGDDAQT